MHTKSCLVLVIVFLWRFAVCAPLSPEQEQDIVNFISYEINNYDVHDEESLNQCLKKVTDLLTPYMKHGIKLWNVPVLDPLFLENVKVTAGDLKAHFKDVVVHGLSEYKLKYLRTNPEDYSFELGLHFTHLKVLGFYKLNGNILMLKLQDHGPFTANFTNLDAVVKNHFKVVNGILHLDKTNTDFKFDKLKFHLDNLFQGGPLGESINQSLNQDVDVLLNELKPGFIKELNKIIVQTLQEGLHNLPLNKWQAAISQ